ncbi:MAG: [protein-PII] uridylyltransferase [Magnetococcales bacterium]|nr:[protein-PII] uridylyltransferase [Magnetococcales bacterium]
MAKFKKRLLIDVTDLDLRIEEILAESDQPALEEPKRGKLLTLFRATLEYGRDRLRRHHLVGARGKYIVQGHTYVMDQLLRRLYALSVHHRAALEEQSPEAKEGGPLLPRLAGKIRQRMKTRKPKETPFALVATGGYGRGELAPCSDVDLLFLLPEGDPSKALEGQVEAMLYFLWDLGIDLGHAVRDINACVEQAHAELEIRTSMLESRFLAGDQKLFDHYKATLNSEVLQHNPAAFLRAKLIEHHKRHERFGHSMFYLEPNVKESPGGLRDIHTFFWISKYRYQVQRPRELVAQGVITEEEFRTFTKSRAFLWRVRNALHYRTGRREDRLTFNQQVEIASEFGYRDRPGMRGVELFMRRYYQMAKQIGHLTQILLQHYETGNPESGENKPHLLEDVFYLAQDKVIVDRPECFNDHPPRLMKVFEVAQRNAKGIHPETLRWVTQSLSLANRAFRQNSEVNSIFLQMLNGKRAVAWVLDRMNTCGLLGRYIPEFGRITGQTQHDLFHVYTVDEHSIRAVEALRHIKQGKFSEELPLSTRLIKQVPNQVILYLATLLHDIAKGRGGLHEIKGAEMARVICARLGLAEPSVELVAWLVRHHLIFSRTAFRRDINDPDTLAAFAKQVANTERLDLLLLLTVADIRAVGPSVWNSWKATLLRRLHARTQEILNRGVFGPAELVELAEEKKQEVRALLRGQKEAPGMERYLERYYPDYLIYYGAETLAAHYLSLVAWLDEPLAIVLRDMTESETTEILVHTQDHPGLFAMIAGALAAAKTNILFANADTTKDGMVLDVFVVQELTGKPLVDPKRRAEVQEVLQQVLFGKVHPETLLNKNLPRLTKVAGQGFVVTTQVVVDNDFSDICTILEITTLDRPGLLFTITRSLSQQGLQIATSKIATYGERVVDVFYVKDLFGMKLTPGKAQRVTDALTKAIEELDKDILPSGRIFESASALLEGPPATEEAQTAAV